MDTVGLVTCSNSPQLTSSDQLLVRPLQKQGFNPVAVAWDDPDIDWSKFDVLIFRSCWNYHLHYEKFLAWLDHLETLRVPTLNPIPIIRWNSNKKYLKDLECKGVQIVPTVFLEKGEKYYLSDIAQHKKWKDLVIKPAIGLYSYNVKFIKQNEYNKKQKEFEKLSAESGVLVQPHMKGTECSLVFIGNEFSHAVRKVPRHIIQQAAAVMKKVNSPLLYARVDAIVQNDTFYLMELECIEPKLYFDLCPRAPTKFAQALQSNANFV